VVAKVGVDGKVSIFNAQGTADYIVDIEGWFGSGKPVLSDAGSSWRFVPGDVVLAPGEAKVVELVQNDAVGDETGSALPPGVTFATTGAVGDVIVEPLGGTKVRVTAGPTIDTVVVGATIPGWDIGPMLGVTIARIRPETVQLRDEQIVFPQTDRPAGEEPASFKIPGVTAEGPGPFTWEEYRARTNLPTDGMASLTDTQSIFDEEYWYPIVIAGSPPPVGSVVLGIEGNVLSGRVMEPAGAPTLQRNGYSLVTISLVGPQAAFLDMMIDITYDDLLGIGVVEPPFSYTSNEGSSGVIAAVGRRTESAFGAASSLSAWRDRCASNILQNSGVSGSGFEFDPAVTLDLKPVAEYNAVIHDGSLQALRIKAGINASLTIGFKVKLQAAVSFEAACEPTEFFKIVKPLPAQARALASLEFAAAVQLKVNFKATVGPSVTVAATCAVSGEMSGGVTYTPAAGFATLASPEPTKSCSWDNGGEFAIINSGANDDSIAVSLEPSVSPLLVLTGKVRIGGEIADIIGDFLQITVNAGENLGLVDLLKAEVGPVVKFVWENVANVLATKDPKSGVTANLEGKAVVELKSFYFIFAKFTVGGTGSSGVLEIPLFGFKVPMGGALPPLKNSRFEVKVNDEDATTSPAIYVQKDDVLKLLSVTAPVSPPLSDDQPLKITQGWVYKKSGTSWNRVVDLGSITPVASTGAEAAYGTTSMQLQVTISETLCDRIADEPVEYAIVGNAPIDLYAFQISMPAWGGTFKLQCVEGTVKWEPEAILDLKPDETRDLEVLTKGAYDDTLVFSGVPAWVEFDSTSVPVSRQLQDDEHVPLTISIKDDGNGPTCPQREATITVVTEHRGSKELKIKEDEKCYLRFDPISITGPGIVTAELQTEGFQAMILPRANITAQLPDWLHLGQPYASDPVANPVNIFLPPSNGEMQTLTFEFSIDERLPKCVDQPARVHIVEFTDALRGHAVLTIRDPKVDKRTDCGFKFTPNHLFQGGYSTLTLVDDTFTNDDLPTGLGLPWSINQPLPAWLTVSPLDGWIKNDGSVEVFLGGSPPYDACLGRSEIHFPVFATVEVPGNRTLDARIVLDYPKIDAIDCTNPTARSAADPHMVSFDGVRWEAQTLGEYVYVQTQPGAPTSMRLVARHQPTNPGFVDESRAPTSVTAVALEVDGNVVEIYPDGSTYIDHAVQPLADGVPVAVNGALSVVRTGDSVRFDAPGLTVTVFAHDGMLDTSVSASFGSDIRGVLGTPDGDQANDFLDADGTVYLPADITNLVLPQFTDFNESWRLTDQADSPFTRQLSLSRFAKASPGFDQAVFDQFGPQADALIAAVATVCDNGASVTVRKRYSVALELSLGTPLSSIEEYLCHYGVQGVAAVDGQPVPGLTVTVDGNGFKQCVTTTGPDGSYLCMVAPDSTEANGITPTLPLSLDVVGTWTGRPGIAAQTTATFPALAPTEGSPLITSADLALDADSVPLLDVSGIASRDGSPLGGDQHFTVEAFDGAGTRVGLFHVTAAVDPDTGAYSFRRALPGTAVRARVVFDVDSPVFERFTGEFSALALGANPVTFDLTYVVPRLTVAGSATDGTAGLAGPITVEVHSTTASGGLLETQSATVVPDPVTGAYTTTIALPRRAANAQAFMVVPPLAETYSTAIVPIAAGPNSVALDVVHTPPIVDVHGTMLDDQGNPLTGSFSLITSFYDVNGTLLNSSNVGLVPDANGDFSLLRVGRVGAVSVEASVLAGVAGERFDSGRVGIVPGANSLQLDVTLAPVKLTVSGTFVDGAGAPLPGPITVYAVFRDVNGEPVGFETASVTPGAGGAYSTEFVGSRTAVSARLLANIGVGAEQYEQIVSGLVSGANSSVFNVAHNPPVLDVAGTLIDSSTGNPLQGPISIGVEFSQPNGTFSGFNTAYATVTPSPVDGSYSFSMAGPHTATKARLTAYLGQNGETALLLVPVLVPGANAVTFNAGFSAPVVTFNGTMLRTGGAALASSAWVTLRSVDADDVQLASTRFQVSIGADGTYSFTRTLPQGSAGAEAIVETSEFASDWQTSGVRAVVDGSQTLLFDVVHEPVQLQVSGTMTKAPGQELVGPVEVGVSALDATGTQLVYRQRTVVPAAGSGAYTFTLTLPMHTDHVDLIAFVGSYAFGFEQEKLTVNGIVPGALATATFDVVHAPATLAVSGTARVDGVLNSGFVEVKATATVPGQVDPLVVTLYPQASNGAYSANLVLPDGATAAIVQVTPFDGANTFSSVQTNLLPNETRNVVIDFDDSPSTLTLSGTMQMFGEPAQSGNVVVRAKDVNGVQLSERTVYLALGTDGGYSVTVPVPTATTQATVIATAGAGLYVTSTQTFDLAGLVLGANARTIDLDSILLELDGTLTADGVPLVVDNEQLTFTTSGTRGGQPFSYTSSAEYETFYTAGSGSFFYSLIVPGDITDATVSINDVADPAPMYVFTGLTPGSYSDTWVTDIDSTPDPRTFTVNGTLLNGGTPWNVGDMDVVITPYAFDVADANTLVPWTDLGAVTQTVTVDPSLGTWTWTGQLPVGTTVVSVEQRPFAMERGYIQTYLLPAGNAPVVETFEHEFGTTELTFLEEVYTGSSCTAPTLLVEYELWAFAAEPVDKSGDPSTWDGAVPVGTSVAVPDLTSRLLSRSFHVPADTTFVHIEIRPLSQYAPGLWNSSVGYDLTVAPDGYYGFGANWEFTCV